MKKDFNYRQIDMVVASKKELTEVIEDYVKLGYAVGVKPRVYETPGGRYFTEYMVVIYKEEEE